MNLAPTLKKESTPRPRRRWLLRIGVGFLVLLLVAVIGFKVYLHSAHARRMAAEQLTKFIGLPVEVESLDFGSSETSAKLRIVERSKPGSVDAGELVRIDSITADVSLFDIISGRAMPKEVNIDGLTITVPIDAEGKLKLELPKPTDGKSPPSLPGVNIRNATLRIRQDGRPEFKMENITGAAVMSKELYEIQGTARDARWGQWKLAGFFDPKQDTGKIGLSVPDGPLDMNLLRSIPYVPLETWDHVRTAGRTAAEVRFEIDRKNEFRYSVDLKPGGAANLVLPDLDVPLTNVKGTIGIRGAKVEIEHCTATLSEGTVKVDGLLDFEPAKSKLSFKVDAAGLDVTKLPAEWSLPPQITGKLRGQADLQLTVHENGTLEPRGGGEATIDDARLGGLPAEVRLRLRGDGRRYRFESEKPAEEKIVFLIQPPPIKELPVKEPQKATTVDATITLRDVDISELLKQIEVEVPYKFAGKVTVKVIAAVPVGEVADRKAYRFRGSLTSSQFFFEGLEVRDVNAELRYRDGVLTLTELKAAFPQKGGADGKLVGTAEAKIEPTGDLTAKLTLTDLPASELIRAVPESSFEFRGRVSGQADFRAPFAKLRDPTTWKGSATLSAPALELATGTVENFTTKATLNRGMLTISEFKGDFFKGSLAGTASVPLTKDNAGRLALEFKEIDSAAAVKLVPGFPVPLTGRITGKLTATADAVKNNQPRAVAADLDLSAPKMTVRGIPAERLAGKITVVQGVADYSLEGRTLGGTFEVKGRYPATAPDGERGHLRLRNLNLARLATSLDAPQFEPLAGLVNVNFDYAADGSTGVGRASITGLKWGRESVAGDLTGSLLLTNGTLDLRDFGGEFAGGRLRTRLRHDFDDPRRSFYVITLDRAALKRIAALVPGDFGEVTGEATLTARGKLGSQAGGQVTLSFSAATIAGVPLTDVVLPLEWTGGIQHGKLTIRDGVARFGQGKLTANIGYTYGHAARLEGRIQFQDVPLRALLPSTSTFGNGKLSGRFDLGGAAIRSLDDVTGTLNATLNQTAVREVPLIRVVTPYLSPSGLVQPFEAGEVKGRLAKGVFRLERFALSNPGAQIFAEGSITRAGRVDLDVVAVTGQVGPNTRALRLLGVPITSIGPLPITVIQRVSDVLSNRMIRLTVTGTIANPSVQINKAALLTDTAVRFFLGQYLIPQNLSAAP